MAWATIHKPATTGVEPNVVDYEDAVSRFSWAGARAELDGLPGGAGLNIAHEAVDRWAAPAQRGQVALRCLDRLGAAARGHLRRAQGRRPTGSPRCSAPSASSRPDTVFLLLPRRPEVYVAALGAMKARCPVSPLFPAFGPEPIRQRMALGRRTGPRDDRSPLPPQGATRAGPAPGSGPRAAGRRPGHLGSRRGGPLPRRRCWPPRRAWSGIGPTDPEDVALLHFTSGTTGTPEGRAARARGRRRPPRHGSHRARPPPRRRLLVHRRPRLGHRHVLRHHRAAHARRHQHRRRGRVRRRPLVRHPRGAAGHGLVHRPHRGADADAGRARRWPPAHDLSALRFVASVGEPLNPEGVVWGQEVLGLPIHDNWWQTETGGIMIANLACTDVKPGSMGRPLPGVEAAVLARDAEHDGAPLVRDGQAVLADPEVEGHLALRPGWPSMFRGYLHEPERYARCFVGGWYVSGRPGPAATTTGTSGSSVAPTTSSSRRGTSSARSRSRARSWSTRWSSRPGSSACPTRWPARS